MTNDRFTRLERWVKVLLASFVALAAVCLYLAVQLRAASGAEPQTPNRIGSMTLLPTGISIETASEKRKSWGALTADDSGSKMGVGVGPVAFAQIATADSPIVTWHATGTVESKILIDTNTGEWTLVRLRYDARYNVIKEEKRQLLPPLEE